VKRVVLVGWDKGLPKGTCSVTHMLRSHPRLRLSLQFRTHAARVGGYSCTGSLNHHASAHASLAGPATPWRRPFRSHFTDATRTQGWSSVSAVFCALAPWRFRTRQNRDGVSKTYADERASDRADACACHAAGKLSAIELINHADPHKHEASALMERHLSLPNWCPPCRSRPTLTPHHHGTRRPSQRW